MTFAVLWRIVVSLLITFGPLVFLAMLPWKALIVLLALCAMSFGVIPIVVGALYLFCMIALWDPIVEV